MLKSKRFGELEERVKVLESRVSYLTAAIECLTRISIETGVKISTTTYLGASISRSETVQVDIRTIVFGMLEHLGLKVAWAKGQLAHIRLDRIDKAKQEIDS